MSFETGLPLPPPGALGPSAAGVPAPSPPDARHAHKNGPSRFSFFSRGTAGAISYALWELGFWGLSLPVCIFGYQQATGHWPDFGDVEDQKKIAAEAFAFVNFARLAVPLRIGLALSTVSFLRRSRLFRSSLSRGC